jgi:XTP/dITP diphosphohydrolase
MFKLLIATNNLGKVEEFQALLQGCTLELLTPASIGLDLQVEEIGESYIENAVLKAKAFSLRSSLWTLADDSGLEVDALGGLPGLHSARFVQTPGATDADRRSWLLHNLERKQKPWRAIFRCALALVSPSGIVEIAEGNCPGEIVPFERGSNGFGYDPIFYLSAWCKTMAELSMQEKNQVSHRARAAQKILPIIQEISISDKTSGRGIA